MEYLLLVVSVFLGMTKSILSKTVKEENEPIYKTLFSNIVMFSVAFVVVTLMAINSLKYILDLPIILALLYAAFTVAAQISFMQAVSLGPVSISSLFYSCGFLLPTIFGTIYYKENFHILQGIGIAFIIVAFYFSVDTSQRKCNIKWLIFALLGLFSLQ